MDELTAAREEIDKIDREMAGLFERRMAEAKKIAAFKRARGLPIEDAGREAALLEKNLSYLADPALAPYYKAAFRAVTGASKEYQRRQNSGARIAYSGVPGAFSYIAARRIFPEAEAVPFGSFRAAYEAVAEGGCDAAVLPIENSYAGDVGQVVDLMFTGALYVSGVYDLRVSHCLLAPRGASISEIETVASHPQALSQCEKYISAHGFRAVEAANTATAARAVAEGGDARAAAIASRETAELYGLSVLDSGINDSSENTTRFAVFTGTEPQAGGTGGSFLLMFTVKNTAGALAKAISVIGGHGFNMRALRSHPMKTLSWQYYFYVEAEGDPDGDEGRAMISELSEFCDRLKVAGRCRAGVTL